MNIIILGAGQVGSSVANILAGEANDITVIDQGERVLQELRDRLDISTVCGHASYPEILRRAGADDADMIIAVTNSDEVNMVACQVAYTLFHTPTKIARVRAIEYLSEQSLFAQNALPIDVMISPEEIVTDHIRNLIDHPGALQVLDFADGRAQLVAVRAYYGGPLVGHELRALRDHLPATESRVAAIYRRGQAILPDGHTVIEPDDEVFFIAARKDINAVMAELRRKEKSVKRVIIAGGGNIGKRLAEMLQSRYQVKIIERSPERAELIAPLLERTMVLRGDAADGDLLLEENIDQTDVFCAVTNDDQVNILSSMLAKRLGVRKVMALINRPAFVDLVQSGAVDIAVSPQQATIGSLLTHVRRGDVVRVHSLRRGVAEAIEAIAHGDYGSSKVVGRRVEELRLPKLTTVGAIVRGEEVLMPHHDLVIESGDHVILFLVDKRRIGEVERLFQVGVNFI